MSLIFNRPFAQSSPFNQFRGFNAGCCPMCQNNSSKGLNGLNVFAGSMHLSPHFPIQKVPNINQKSTEIICRFIQNEKNAIVYYKELAEKTNIEKNKFILYSISSNAAKEIDNAKNICSSLSIGFNEPMERSINTHISFNAGISLALEEENKALNELCALLDQCTNELYSQISPIILRKMSRLNSLYLIQINL